MNSESLLYCCFAAALLTEYRFLRPESRGADEQRVRVERRMRRYSIYLIK
jgi:hypothetical protein